MDTSACAAHTGARAMFAKGLDEAAGASAVDDASPPPPRLALTILRALSTSSDAFSKLLGSISTCCGLCLGSSGLDGVCPGRDLVVFLLLCIVLSNLPVTRTFFGRRDQVICGAPTGCHCCAQLGCDAMAKSYTGTLCVYVINPLCYYNYLCVR